MACQLLANFFGWGLKNENQQPTVKLALTTYRLQAGLKGQPPHQVATGAGSGELFYTRMHIEEKGKVTLHIPASFAGEIRYTPEGAGATQDIQVQIIDFGDAFSVTFHPPAALLHGGFVPSCGSVPIGTLAGAITGLIGDLQVTMHLTEA